MRRWLFLGLAGALGCAQDTLANGGFDILCSQGPCDWQVVAGAITADRSWHFDDAGLDLSGESAVVLEQRSAPLDLQTRTLELQAAIWREEGVSLQFELAWYVHGSGSGATYWDRAPTLIDTRPVVVEQSGVFLLRQLVSTPSPEVDGLRLRIVKSGSGRIIVDEVALCRFSYAGQSC
jgi:hypothetical protein